MIKGLLNIVCVQFSGRSRADPKDFVQTRAPHSHSTRKHSVGGSAWGGQGQLVFLKSALLSLRQWFPKPLVLHPAPSQLQVHTFTKARVIICARIQLVFVTSGFMCLSECWVGNKEILDIAIQQSSYNYHSLCCTGFEPSCRDRSIIGLCVWLKGGLELALCTCSRPTSTLLSKSTLGLTKIFIFTLSVCISCLFTKAECIISVLEILLNYGTKMRCKHQPSVQPTACSNISRLCNHHLWM